MNKKLYAGISQIVLGILIAIAPQTFAHVCAVKETPMACHYTAQAALGGGGHGGGVIGCAHVILCVSCVQRSLSIIDRSRPAMVHIYP